MSGAGVASWPGSSEDYYRLMRKGTLGRLGLHDALVEAWQAGAEAEAEARRDGRSPAALEVAETVDGFGQYPALAGEDEAHFAGLAAQIFYAGTPLRRRLGLAWRLLRPQWVERLADRRARRKGGAG